jgi:SAM-dependent methyltransferase
VSLHSPCTDSPVAATGAGGRSSFSAVDASPAPDSLARYLDMAAEAESGMKHYTAAAHALRRPGGPVLDLGSGGGHDLALLASAGLKAVGVDPSAVMMQASQARAKHAGTPLVQATGEHLPFRDGAFAGCRIERVLMHVEDPVAVLAEALRCLRPAGLITVFEPDWTRFEIASELIDPGARWLVSVANPGIGGQLWGLLEAAGCDVVDRVEELSVWHSLSTMERVNGFPRNVDRAVKAGRQDADLARRWVAEQRRRNADSCFRASIPKILVVATKRETAVAGQ